ncbi:MAG: glutathione peroxidase [Gammaproteobacteria bacterium]|nr:glutathione peroxidase [Gammaproteobacteria bacterium]
MNQASSIYDIPLVTLDEQPRTLAEYRDRVLLIVNVASRCGYTPQYAALEALHRKYGPRGCVVLGFPCNQFGRQEPGDAADIRAFCSSNYDVTFPLFAKIDVNGRHAHPLYRHLKSRAPGILGSRSIKWNFTKFLVGAGGGVVERHAPSVRPDVLAARIEALLAR